MNWTVENVKVIRQFPIAQTGRSPPSGWQYCSTGGKRICKAAGLSHTRNMISKNGKEILLFETHICAEIAGPIAL